MATPGVQVPGAPAETQTAAQTAGYLGWSPEADRSMYRLIGGTPRGVYATLTAYAVGEVVTYGGAAFRALAAVPSTNSTPPAVGAVWADAGNHRGTAEIAPTSRFQHYR